MPPVQDCVSHQETNLEENILLPQQHQIVPSHMVRSANGALYTFLISEKFLGLFPSFCSTASISPEFFMFVSFPPKTTLEEGGCHVAFVPLHSKKQAF